MTRNRPLQISGKTHVGLVRQNNEDSFVVDEELGLMVVADGMGGHNAGEVASELAASAVWEHLRNSSSAGAGGSSDLAGAITAANGRIFAAARQSPARHGMGTTIVAAIADGRSLRVAHVGDSRAYLFRAGTLTCLTTDHSVVGEQLSKGLLRPEDAGASPFSNVLTRALGPKETVEIDHSERALQPGDVIVIATDGLTKTVSDHLIATAVADNDDPEPLADRLIELALAAGGTDNVTVIAARLSRQGRRADGSAL
jgi:protein phosphatase